MHSNSDNYNNTVNYLYGLQKHGIKLGLNNTGRLMSILGMPHRSFHSVHTAGTNGKGSTSAALASILIESGYKTGLFTSPHLVSFTERIRINDRQISESDVISIASEIKDLIKDSDLNPTFFEFVTAMAFHYFAKNNVDWAVIETGLGGRLDATNVLQPELTIITNISLDHCDFLGTTISDITYEKAGIIKEGIPLITSSSVPEIVQQLSDAALAKRSEIHIYNKDYKSSLLEMDDKHITIDYSGYDEFSGISVPLSGRYQVYNTSMAIRAAEILMRKGFSITGSSIRNGLEKLHMEGRFECISDSPTVILDCAHNPGAADALADSLMEIFPDKEIILIAGIMDDKNITDILGPLIKISGPVILTRPAYDRAASIEKLRNTVNTLIKENPALTDKKVLAIENISDALRSAKELLKENSIILITGSFYTTGEVKEILGQNAILPGLREHR